jgi:hypothetical protein
MDSPMTNFELGKMQHREYEAQASRYWGQMVTSKESPGQTTATRLAVALGGLGLIIGLFVQLLPL